MNLLNMFANLAGDYQNRYLTLANKFAPPPTGGLDLRSQAGMNAVRPTNNDTYIPTPTSVSPDATPAPAADQTDPSGVQTNPDGDQYTPSPEAASEAESPATYKFTRQARLDYSMTLKFDLSSMMQITQSLAEGDVMQVEEFAAAGFGLSADIQFDGSQTIRTSRDKSGGDGSGRTNSVQQYRASDLNMRTIASQGRGFQTEGFQREASQIRRSLHVNIQGRHQQATNKLSMRYRLDSGFKFSFLDRFNVQTKQMTDGASAQVGGFVDSAGAVAEKGSPEMMAAFFDAVDQYLDQTEQSMTAQTSAKFQMAANELGFEGELVDGARDKLVSTVGRFFDRIETAMNTLEARFVPSDTSAGLQTDPTQMFRTNPFAPSMSQDSSFLATA